MKYEGFKKPVGEFYIISFSCKVQSRPSHRNDKEISGFQGPWWGHANGLKVSFGVMEMFWGCWQCWKHCGYYETVRLDCLNEIPASPWKSCHREDGASLELQEFHSLNRSLEKQIGVLAMKQDETEVVETRFSGHLTLVPVHWDPGDNLNHLYWRNTSLLSASVVKLASCKNVTTKTPPTSFSLISVVSTLWLTYTLKKFWNYTCTHVNT